MDINKSTICNKYIEVWKKSINDVELYLKLRTYCALKSEFEMEMNFLPIRDFGSHVVYQIKKPITAWLADAYMSMDMARTILCYEMKGSH